MDCPNCGLANPPSALRCDCGHALPTGPKPASPDEHMSSQGVASPAAGKTTRKKFGIIAGIVVGIILLNGWLDHAGNACWQEYVVTRGHESRSERRAYDRMLTANQERPTWNDGNWGFENGSALPCPEWPSERRLWWNLSRASIGW